MRAVNKLQAATSSGEANLAKLRYAPAFGVAINGETIPATLRASITSVNYQTGLEGADRVEINLVNENLRWLDHDLLKLDNTLELSIGYAPDPLERVFVGEIVGQNASFPASGGPTLTVVAQDRMYRLQQHEKNRFFQIPAPGFDNFPIPDPAIGSFVSFENRLLPTIDLVGAALAVLLGGLDALSVALGQSVVRKQQGESDADLLQRIARCNGLEMFIDHGGKLGGHKLRFMSTLSHLNADLTLKYGYSLVDFTPKITNVGQIAGVSLRVWVSEIKTEFTITVYWDWDRQELNLLVFPGVGQSTFGAGLGDAVKAGGLIEFFNKPVNLLNAPREIIGSLLPRLNNRLTGQGSTVGDPRIKAGTVLQLEGIGKQFGGRYRVTLATHSFGSGGYTTSFEVRKDIWFGSIPPFDQGAIPVPLHGPSLEPVADRIRDKAPDVVKAGKKAVKR